MPENQTKLNHNYKDNLYIIYYKDNLALNNLRWLIRHKTQPNQILYI